MRFLSTWLVPGRSTHARDGYKRATVEAPTWMLAKEFMACIHPGSVTAKASDLDPAATIELRWIGDDYAHGGTTNGKRTEVRFKNDEGWGPWEAT